VLVVPGAPPEAMGVAALFPEFDIARVPPRDGGVPFATIGEGVLRAMPRGGGPRPLLSVTANSLSGPTSALDTLDAALVLADRAWESPELLKRAASARRALVAAEAGGEWWLGDNEGLPRDEPYVLVALDREDDAAVAAMLEIAFTENAASRLVVLGPFVAHHLARLQSLLDRVRVRDATVIAAPCDPWAAFAGAERVYTVGGELGFLALLAGRNVSCFGDAFFAGWGATVDAPTVPRRAFARSIDEIFAGACLVATRYLDPFRDAPASFEDALSIVAEWRRIDRVNREIAVCVGMSFWKRRRVADFLRSADGPPAFERNVAGALAATRRPRPGAIAVWSSRIPAGLEEAAAKEGIPLFRVEDGFVRSAGLGSDFLPPASLVLDRRGMYFDPRASSDLEILLRDSDFTPTLTDRASRLIEELVRRGITKYNLAGRAPTVDWPPGRRRVLVPGQVEDDLSVVLGGGDIRTNLALLARVRAARPDAFIVYKPHPDVVAGHRKGAVAEAAVRQYADAVVANVATAALLGEIDELHTLTSLAGFEALLRRRLVIVYGRPWYAGWGLTNDASVIDRGRILTLEELVAGALILYPRYLDPVTRLSCGPEIIIERLDRPELWRAGSLVRARRMQGAVRRWIGRIATGRASPRRGGRDAGEAGIAETRR